MSENFQGRAGTTERESIDFSLDRETIGQVYGRYTLAFQFLLAELILLSLTATIPYLLPNGKELASVLFGMGLTLAMFVAVVGLVAAGIAAFYRVRRRLANRWASF